MMNTVPIERLSTDAFREFGVFADMLHPASEVLGTPPLEFFRDMAQQTLGACPMVSYSNCRIGWRDPVIDVSECHSHTAEMMMPLDGDVLMHFAPACPQDAGFPSAKARVFHIPKGTMVILKPGTWHHGPFTLDGTPVNVLVALPERTYANDCQVVRLDGEHQIRIDLPTKP